MRAVAACPVPQGGRALDKSGFDCQGAFHLSLLNIPQIFYIVSKGKYAVLPRVLILEEADIYFHERHRLNQYTTFFSPAVATTQMQGEVVSYGHPFSPLELS